MSNLAEAKNKKAVINNSSHRLPLQCTLSDIFTEHNLKHAYLCARKGKRKRHKVFKFELELNKNLSDLRQSILNKTYTPDKCSGFDIYCTAGQKIRHIRAPSFRDNIAQFCIYNYLFPLIDKHLIFHTCGCRRGKGQLLASNLVNRYIRQSDKELYYLQTDIKKYYYSITRDKLKECLDYFIYNEDVKDLILSWCNKDKGLNVGALISQFLGLIFLSEIDHYIKRVLKVKGYVRYVDDMVFIGLTRAQCHIIKGILELKLHDFDLSFSKWRIVKLKQNVNFCGYRNYGSFRLVRKRLLRTFNRSIKKMNFIRMQSVLAYAQHSVNYLSMLNRINSINITLPLTIKRRIENDLLV